jgi:hypothetical protein
MTNQHTTILFLVVLVPWVLNTNRRLLETENLTNLAFYFALGLAPYIYIPISAFINRAPLTWGDQRTIEGLFS